MSKDLAKTIFYFLLEKKSGFCKTLSALYWCQLYQCADAQNRFSMMITFISNAFQQHAQIKETSFAVLKLKTCRKRNGLIQKTKKTEN